MKKYILLAAAAISLSACNTEDDCIDNEPVSLQISASIGGSSLSRVSGDAWDIDDKIGVSLGDRYTNLMYTTENGDGTFAGTPMYFQNKMEKLTLTAYYPYTGSEGETPSIINASTSSERQTPEEQQKFDFLYAVKENVTASESNINLVFSHKMSKLTITFENGNDGTDVSKITSCEINGLVLDGTFNPSTGECVASDTPATPLILSPSVTNDKVGSSLILFPQTVDKVTMKITDSEAQEYSCELKFTGNRLEPGNNYLYTITVKKTGLTVHPCKIAKWTESKLGSEAVSD